MATIIKGKNANKPYTVRYWHDNRQRERSFRTSREAKDFVAKFEHDSRENIFVDPRESSTKFKDAAERWVSNLTGAPLSKKAYENVLRAHINPLIGDRSLRAVATDRYGMEELLKETLPKRGLGASAVHKCYLVMRAVVNDAIKAGKLSASRINGITLPQVSAKANITFATHEQLSTMADEMPDNYGLAIWLMRGCGLRIGEALAVRWENFKDGQLRITEQLLQDGTYAPLKHRDEDDFRDIPVPQYVLKAMGLVNVCGRCDADLLMSCTCEERYGYVFVPGRYRFARTFNKARDEVGLPKDFTPHTLRHIFASVSLSNGIPITDVSAWLGHRNINMTYSIYGHLVPSSIGNARHVLDVEYDTWKETS